MNDGSYFASLRDTAVSHAESGDFAAAARLFREALHRGASEVYTPTASAPPLAPPPSAADLATVHDMLAQCLMELALAKSLAAEQTPPVALLGPPAAPPPPPPPPAHHNRLNQPDQVPQLGQAPPLPTERQQQQRQQGTWECAAWEAVQVGAEMVEKDAGVELWQEAVRHAGEACAIRPGWPPAHLTYGRCLRNCGLLDESLRALNRAMQLLGPGHVSSGSRESSRHTQEEPTPGAAGAGPATSCGSTAGSLGAAVEQRRCGRRCGAGDPDAAGSAAGQDNPSADVDPDLAAEVAQELEEVSELWQQRLARDVGLPGLRVRQDAGGLGGGPGRRVWECGIVLAAFLVQQQRRGQRRGQPPQQEQQLVGCCGAQLAHGCGDLAVGSCGIGWLQLAGARVLELGCGSGLAGLVAAAACGARCVVTDLPHMLHATAACAAANAELIRRGGGWLAVHPLDWADVAGANAAAAVAWLLRGGGPWGAAGSVTAAEAGAAQGRCPSETSGPGAVWGRHAEAPTEPDCNPGRGESAWAPECTACDSTLSDGVGEGGSGCWVVGADLVYAEAHVGLLVGLLADLRRRAVSDAAGGTAQLGRDGDLMGTSGPVLAPLVPLPGTAQLGRDGDPMGTSGPVLAPLPSSPCLPRGRRPPDCHLLLAHKHRSDALSSRMFAALDAAGLPVQEIALSGMEGMGALASRFPNVALYTCRLW